MLKHVLAVKGYRKCQPLQLSIVTGVNIRFSNHMTHFSLEEKFWTLGCSGDYSQTCSYKHTFGSLKPIKNTGFWAPFGMSQPGFPKNMENPSLSRVSSSVFVKETIRKASACFVPRVPFPISASVVHFLGLFGDFGW